MGIKLVKPSIIYAGEIMDYREEFLQSRETMAGCGNLRVCESAKEWIEQVEKMGNKTTCPKDKVPSTTYLAVRTKDQKIVGIIDLRHHINHPVLSMKGGHIGYSVRPSERKQGYATYMLGEVLKVCKQYGIMRVLVTCDTSNIGSKKVIIKNGGVQEKTITVNGGMTERYWIEQFN